jgi:hypothetical protein
LAEPIFPPRRRSRGTWRCWTNPAWKRCARCFWKTCWRARRSAHRKAGLWDRLSGQWLLMDVDGTKQAASPRALPATEDLPAAYRRFDRVCAPGHLGRKRGEVVRTRTTILQAHTHQFLGTFGHPGNGQCRQELKQARAMIAAYAHALSFPLSHIVIRLDGLYGDAAPLADLLAAQAGEEEGPAVVVRGKAYHLLEQPVIQQRLKLAPDQVTVHPESGASRALYDGGRIQLAPTGPVMRMLVATHPAGASRPPIGKVREGIVYEQFFTTLPSPAFTPADVLDLYLHRGSFETALADEDEEQATDRWVSRTRVVPGVLADHSSMDMEPSLGAGTARPGDNDARDGFGLFAGAGTAA